jgi:hypothetical protein
MATTAASAAGAGAGLDGTGASLWARAEVLQLVVPTLGSQSLQGVRPLTSDLVLAAVKKLVKVQTPEGKIR